MKGDGGRWGLWASGIPPPPLSRLREHNAEKKKSEAVFLRVLRGPRCKACAPQPQHISLSLFLFQAEQAAGDPGLL